MRTFAAVIAALLALSGAARPAAAKCEFGRIAEIPVIVHGTSALMNAKINGTEETFQIDSGAFYSLLTPEIASELRLPLSPPPSNLTIMGVGGMMSYHLTTVKEFTILGVPVRNLQFIVGGPDMGFAGVIGQNVLGLGDPEYDFANGAVRLWRPRGCGNSVYAYWIRDGQAYSQMDIAHTSQLDPSARGTAYVNGTRIEVTFDTGASTSMLSLKAAARAGVRPGDPGVTEAGYSYGAGQSVRRTWVGPFASFRIGDEEIRNTHLRIAEISTGTDMLLGADFFLSHRVLVSNTQRRVYFTYNGGPVFNLSTLPDRPPAASAGAAAPNVRTADAAAAAGQAGTAAPAGGAASAPASPSRDETGTAEPVDAIGYGRRAAIHLVRKDYAHAIADLTRAIELDPGEPLFLRQRATAYLGAQQPEPAHADLDRFLAARPGDAGALLARAALLMGEHRMISAIADLDTAARMVPKEAGEHLTIGRFYESMDRLEPAIAEYGLWIASHREDPRWPQGLYLRCHARARWGQELDKALSDCNAIVRRVAKEQRAPGLASRGLVRLRRGELDRSIDDYNDALRIDPRDAEALFGRGLARLRRGATAEGQADLAAARGVDGHIGDEFAKIGLAP